MARHQDQNRQKTRNNLSKMSLRFSAPARFQPQRTAEKPRTSERRTKRVSKESPNMGYTRVVDMLNHLTTAQINGRLGKALKTYVRPNLLLLDELGYLPIDKR